MNTHLRKREFLRLLGLSAAAGFALPAWAANHKDIGMYSVRDFGATGEGKHPDTKAIQAAVEACAKAGGGTVLFPAGTYLSGTIFLRQNVTLYLDSGAILLGSTDLKDYPSTIPALRSFVDNYTERSLIYAEKVEGIGIAGHGTIDGQGASFKGEYKLRPYLVRFVSCRDISTTGITFKDSAMWVQHYLACDDVNIEGIRVRSRVSLNADGIDIDSCRRVRIANCDIASRDDAIVLKSTLNRICRDILISNCVLLSDCNAFKIGTESIGGFQDIAMNNCVIHETKLAGIALQTVDGAALERVNIGNITMRNVGTPLAIRLGNRGLTFGDLPANPKVSTLSDINLHDLQVNSRDMYGSSITGLPEHLVNDVSLENVHITFAGGGKETDAQMQVPEHPAKYPGHTMFGKLPSYGFYCRHVKGLRFRNVRLDVTEPDYRPAFICDDVQGLEFLDCSAPGGTQNNPLLHFQDVSNGLVQGWRARPPTKLFLRIAGEASQKIRLVANDPAVTRTMVEVGAEVPQDAMRFAGAEELPTPIVR